MTDILIFLATPVVLVAVWLGLTWNWPIKHPNRYNGPFA